MKMSDRIKCILSKIINILIILAALAFTPMQFILYKIEINHWVAGSLLVFFSGLLFLIGWFGLLKTNNPLTRYNPFSINRQWKGNTDKEAYLKIY